MSTVLNFASASIWGSMATWEDAKGTRWVLTPFWGPVHPKFNVPVTHGPVTQGAIVAFKVEEKNGKLQLTPARMSRDIDQAEPPAIGNGVVFAFGSKLRIAASTHASLYALDGETGKDLYSSGDQIPTWNHFEELNIANGRAYLGTFDSVLYCFGQPNGTPKNKRRIARSEITQPGIVSGSLFQRHLISTPATQFACCPQPWHARRRTRPRPDTAQTTAAAISSGLPMRTTGSCAITVSRTSGVAPLKRSIIGVSIMPGHTGFVRMFACVI